MKNLQLKNYNNFQGDLRGTPVIGSVSYMGGIPFNYELFTASMQEFVQYNSQQIKGLIHYEPIRSSSHAYSRNIIAQHCVGDWVLMLDTDLQFDPDILVRMLEVVNKHNLFVLTGVYLYKRPPYWPVLYAWDPKKKKYQTIRDWRTPDDRLDIFGVDAAGAGILFVKKAVFDYIRDQLKEQPFEHRRPFDNPDGDMLGEDLAFFDRCRQLGIKIACDPRITASHLRVEPVTIGKQYNPHIIDPSIK